MNLKSATTFIILSVSLILASIYIAYHVQSRSMKRPYTFFEFINDGKTLPSLKDIIVGLTFGTVFGALDAVGTWVGMNQTTRALPKYSPEIRASLAGLYSNVMSISLSTIISLVVKVLLGSTSTQEPIWVNVLGVLTGSIIGIYLGLYFLPSN